MTSDPVHYFNRLGVHECWALLAEQIVGRVAWLGAEGIEILPVNYTVMEQNITFHTSTGSPLTCLTQPTSVAFQVDEIDTDTAVAWSVLVRGTTGPGRDTAPAVSWLVGDQPVTVAISPTSITGRVISGKDPDRSTDE